MASSFHHYRPHLTDTQALEAISVAREALLEEIVGRLGRWEPGQSRQHYLLIGPRGIGKTHVLRLIEHRIRSSPALAQKWRPICFPEEQYAVTSVADLLLETLDHLARAVGDPSLVEEHRKLRSDPDDERVVDLSLDALRRYCTQERCGLLVMVENLGRLLETQVKRNTQIRLLRKILTEEEWIVLLATSPTYLTAVTDPSKPFFEFFQLEFLAELSPDDVERMLRKVAQFQEDADFLKYLESYRPRLRALYHFSGGNPRLTLMLYELLSRQTITDLRIEMEALLDQLTPFYQDRMKELGPQEAKVLAAMALLPEGCTPTELGRECRLSRGQVSALLSRLEKAGYVRPEPRSQKKTIYIIPERFFRIWHQMSHSRVERARIQHLLDFFSTWYATEEERDQVWTDLLAKFHQGAQEGDPRRVEDASAYMDYIATVSEGDERFTRQIDRLGRHADAGEVEFVLKELDSLDDEFADDARYFVHKGEFVANRLGDHELGLEAFRRAMELKRDHLEALFNHGVALDRMGRKRAAFSAYTRAVELLSTQRGRQAAEDTTSSLLQVLREEHEPSLVRIAAYLLGRMSNPSVCLDLLGILQEADAPWRRRHCCTALGLLGSPDATTALLKCLADDASDVRGSAATALGNIGSPDAMPVLIDCLRDEASNVRGSAATALGNIGSPDAVPALIDCLGDGDAYVRGSAATALGNIGSPDAMPALIDCLRDEASNVRGSAATALGNIGSPDAVPALIDCLRDEASNVRASAATALGRIGTEEAVAGLVDAAPDIIDALREGGDEPLGKAASLLLRAAFRSGNVEVAQALLTQFVSQVEDGEDIFMPHQVALDYLLSERDETIIRRQHPEMREAVELLVSVFDEGAKRSEASPDAAEQNRDHPGG